MDFPTLSRLKFGQRHTLNQPIASADAHTLAHLAANCVAQKRTLIVVCALAIDAQRLLDELAFFNPNLKLAYLPDWETLPYDQFSPHQDLISERLATLSLMMQGEIDVLLVAATTAINPVPAPEFLAAYTFDFKQGQKLNADKLKSQLTLAGYQHVSNVVRPGEYTVRGGLIDLFPMGSLQPYRVDLFDDEIDSIRAFDPDTQRSLYPVPTVHLLPGHEFPMDEQARAEFKRRWVDQAPTDPTKSRMYKDIAAGIVSSGIEYYLPLFYARPARLFDYLTESAIVVMHGDVSAALNAFWLDAEERYRIAATDADRPALPPAQIFVSTHDFYTQAKVYSQIVIRERSATAAEEAQNANYLRLPPLQTERGGEQPLARLKAHLAATKRRLLLIAHSEGRRESLRDFVRSHGLTPHDFDSLAQFTHADAPLGIAVANIFNGFGLAQPAIDLVTENELFAATTQAHRRKKQESANDLATLIQDLSELREGDPIVHAQHGIGRYRGLMHLDLQGNGEFGEFLHLEYAAQALLYVPVAQLHLISRYTGVSANEAPLHRLGSGQWDKARKKAAEQVRDTAAELLTIYASRAAKQGHNFRFDAVDYERFAADFDFDETPDQLAAIHAVVQDMVSPKPMDRLVCGDVGFGKTEVALRAAFIAVNSGKQVALLAPTTLLAEQHYQTLIDRFSKWPVKIAEMSRFRSAKEISEASLGLADGRVDIVVGTHKLLSPTITFKDLGLLIVDEEHRFGVRHKEAMKAMRAEVDVLTLTATPIPRTMGMALEGLRDLSVIATAPERRLAIKTFVRTENNSTIREAILRELKRGGQCYFLHNEVATIQNRKETLEKLIPEARIGIAHGQMPERELERVMRDFVAQRFNTLLCSTIIETGIDVPTANTIVMSRADKFGLAQLHQLRGRVGRSHHQAYAYLLVPDVQSLSKSATLRLDAIQQMEELGSGFYLAMHDLEIRGAGEVLGDNQSGNMLEIGFQLYNEMLTTAVRDLKNGKEPDLLNLHQNQCEINLHSPTLLPNDFCGDVHIRLSFYKKLAMAQTNDQLERIQEELADRFGKLPPAVLTLIDQQRLRLVGSPLGLIKLDSNPKASTLSFKEHAAIDPMRIITLIQKNRHIKLVGNAKLRIERDLPDVRDRVLLVRDVLCSLTD